MELRAEALQITYRDASGAAFTGLDIEELILLAGQSLAITGPSGSGKSTLLYALAGLIGPIKGRIFWHGVDILGLSPSARNVWRRQNMGFVFQEFQLLPELSPLENVLLPARFAHFMAPHDLARRATQLLLQFGVPVSRKNCGQLSRGEQQRVAIARALLFDPPIILADEPTASLDEAAAQTVIETLFELAEREARTVIIVSHDAALIARSARNLRLTHGRVHEKAAT